MKRFHNINLLFKIYTLALAVFFIFRLILFFTELNRINLDSDSTGSILYSFLIGVRFDIVIIGYISFFPAFILLTLSILRKNIPLLNKILFYWFLVLFTVAFSISSADIPYFNHFFSRFSIGAFEWMNNFGFVFQMLTQEPKYIMAFLPFIIFVSLFYFILKRIFKAKPSAKPSNVFMNIGLSVLVLGLIFLGIRGRIEKKSPIRIGTAYFSSNPFLNQLGLNPVFTLMHSYIESQKSSNQAVQLMPSLQAIELVQQELNIKNSPYNSPIARFIKSDTSIEQKPFNVVLVIMESMSTAKMGRHGNTKNLTPFLDSISNQSLYFDNIYTAGKHTFNGIFGTLFSFPSLYRQHPMKKIKQFNGISSILQKNGYSTSYFTTHDSQFDNVEGFLRANNFENIISQSDYPKEEVKTTLGVPDDYMFRFSIPYLDKLHQKGKPFFASFMTASDHGPYYIPKYFTPNSSKIKNQVVEYADWSIQQFIEQASGTEWFPNTLFVFIADHGAPISASYAISLDYHHSPLILYAPEIINETKTISKIGGQIDVGPTLLGMLNIPYLNNTMGIDLLRESRPYIIINDDDKIGVLDTTHLLILKEDNQMSLFHYLDSDKTDYSKSLPEKTEAMSTYAKSNLQVFQDMLLEDQQFIQQK